MGKIAHDLVKTEHSGYPSPRAVIFCFVKRYGLEEDQSTPGRWWKWHTAQEAATKSTEPCFGSPHGKGDPGRFHGIYSQCTAQLSLLHSNPARTLVAIEAKVESRLSQLCKHLSTPIRFAQPRIHHESMAGQPGNHSGKSAWCVVFFYEW